MGAVIIWILLSFFCGKYAETKGKDFANYFLISLIITPLIGFIALLISKPNTKRLEKEAIETGENKKCLFCAELIKAEALKCRFCGELLISKIKEDNIENSIKPENISSEVDEKNKTKIYDDMYVSVGYGNYKKTGKEKDNYADIFTKTDSGEYVKTELNDISKTDSKSFFLKLFYFVLFIILVISIALYNDKDFQGFQISETEKKKYPEKNKIKYVNNDRLKVEKLNESHCVEVIRCLSPTEVAKEIGKTTIWAAVNYTVAVWEKPTHLGKGRKVGDMSCGTKAMILDRIVDDYKIISPLDQSIGWVNKIQISGTSFQHPITQETCIDNNPESIESNVFWFTS